MTFTLLKYWLRNENPLPTGALIDDRKPIEKIDDVHFEEIVASAAPVNWVTKTSFRTYPVLNQRSSYTCGANALSKSWGIQLEQKYGKYVQLSRGHIYQRRIGKGEGMALHDMFRIASEGATLEQLTGEEIYKDADADKLPIDTLQNALGQVFAVNKGIYLGNDIETIASVIQTTGKGVIMLAYFLSGEWSKEYPTIVNPLLTVNDPSSLRHFIVAVDYTLINGKKYLVIEDSAHFGAINRRFLSEEFIKNRVMGAGYLMNFKYGTSKKVSYDGWTIISAQECLQAEGLFPTNISFAENIGNVTRGALEKFQKKYGLTVTRTLDTDTKNLLHRLYP